MNISIVVPVYNEAENIAPLLQEIGEAMKAQDVFEIIYINDGSTDNTADILRQEQKKHSALRVLQHEQSYGQSAAIYTGIRAARYSCIATLDGDGQNDPMDIMRLKTLLLQKRQSNPKLWMVAGWRQKRHDSTWKLFSSRVANAFRSKALGDKTPDSGCGLKVFLRKEFLTLPYFDHMHRFLPALIIRAGGQVQSECVNHRPRAKGYSKYGTLDRLWVGIFDTIGVMWLQKRAKIVEIDEIECR